MALIDLFSRILYTSLLFMMVMPHFPPSSHLSASSSISSSSSCFAMAENNGLALRPPMGWNSWYALGCEGLNEEEIIKTANFLSTPQGSFPSLLSLGYNIITLDDCWANMSRNAQGEMIGDPKKFPSGMRNVSLMLQQRGFGLGLYTTPESLGNYTCEMRPASGGHEEEDANQFILNFEAKYIKYCVCNTTKEWRQVAYNIFSDAVNATGVATLLECDPFMDQPWTWMGPICNVWSCHDDIDDNFEAWTEALNEVEDLGVAAYAGPGGWNLPDMMQIGGGGQTQMEYMAQYSLYAIVASPMILSTNVEKMTEPILSILTNRHVIDISQDSLGIQGRRVKHSGGAEVWARPLTDCRYAVAFLNRNSATRHPESGGQEVISISFQNLFDFDWDSSITPNCPLPKGSIIVTDVWHELHSLDSISGTLESASMQLSENVQPHSAVVFLMVPANDASSPGMSHTQLLYMYGGIGAAVVLMILTVVAIALGAMYINLRRMSKEERSGRPDGGGGEVLEMEGVDDTETKQEGWDMNSVLGGDVTEDEHDNDEFYFD